MVGLKDYERYWLEGLDVDLKESLAYGFTKWKGYDNKYIWLYSKYDYTSDMFLFNRMVESEEDLKDEMRSILKSHDEILDYAGFETVEDFIENQPVCSALTTIQDYNGWYFERFAFEKSPLMVVENIINLKGGENNGNNY